MEAVTSELHTPATIRTDLGAIFVSLELSRSTWLITSLSPGNGENMSKHSVGGGDVAALLDRFTQLQEKALSRTRQRFPILTIQEAGLDGFWIDRVLKVNGIESYVVDPASIATSRRRRRAKTDRLVRYALATRGRPAVIGTRRQTQMGPELLSIRKSPSEDFPCQDGGAWCANTS